MACTPDFGPPVRFQQIQSSTVPERERSDRARPRRARASTTTWCPRSTGRARARSVRERAGAGRLRRARRIARPSGGPATRWPDGTVGLSNGPMPPRSHVGWRSRSRRRSSERSRQLRLQLRQGRLDEGPDLGGVVLDKPGSGKVLGELPVGSGHDLAVLVDGKCPHP